MVFTQFRFSRLTNLVQAGNRIFVTEQTGRVLSFPKNADTSESTPFFDIRIGVSDSGNEEGVLGFDFDPDFDTNVHFFVYYSASQPRRSVISQFTAIKSGDQSVTDPDSELVILQAPQPFSNHNVGQL